MIYKWKQISMNFPCLVHWLPPPRSPGATPSQQLLGLAAFASDARTSSVPRVTLVAMSRTGPTNTPILQMDMQPAYDATDITSISLLAVGQQWTILYNQPKWIIRLGYIQSLRLFLWGNQLVLAGMHRFWTCRRKWIWKSWALERVQYAKWRPNRFTMIRPIEKPVELKVTACTNRTPWCQHGLNITASVLCLTTIVQYPVVVCSLEHSKSWSARSLHILHMFFSQK